MSPKNDTPSNVVKGSPSKELFIDMLTRDISLTDAISDLVDNCVDGAIRLRANKKFTGLEVDITVKDNCFKIKDNCGGIDKDLAQNYAFRFGRPSKAPRIDYSVGQFGIGMKRALFKMGKHFEIKSVSAETSFTIEIDVNRWSQKEDEWDFEFKSVTEKKVPLSKCGTEIKVTSLNKDVIERFKHNNFISELRGKLELQHLINLSKKLTMKINNRPIISNQLKLYDGKKFTTAYWAKKYRMYDNMDVKIYAGIGEQRLDEGGWYLFCNDRLIRGPEQTVISGWGAKSPMKIPEYHSQFNGFRGIVLFESKTLSFLPWNTSKTSVDTDSQLFQNVRQEMICLMRPIIDFLNEVHRESTAFHNNQLDEKYLQNQIDSAALKNYLDVKTSSKFSAPVQKQKPRKANEVKISYTRPKGKVEELKRFFKVKSRKQVGEKTFDYTYDRECKE